MIDDMVMRSVYLWPRVDDQLRELAFDRKLSKSDLIRSAIAAKLREWLADGGDQVLVEDLKLGQRDGGNSRRQVLTAKAAAAALTAEGAAATPVARTRASTKSASWSDQGKAKPRPATRTEKKTRADAPTEAEHA